MIQETGAGGHGGHGGGLSAQLVAHLGFGREVGVRVTSRIGESAGARHTQLQ